MSTRLFPPAHPEKAGWPWEAAIPDVSAQTCRIEKPKISVVTPSFNQAAYLEATIRSVLLQNYPDLEYFVLDGGSTDASVSIIKKYEPWLAHWQSARDGGQTDAIREGIRRVTGDLIAWQNSDDFYYPGSFEAVAKAAVENPEVEVFFGEVDYVDSEGRFVRPLSILEPTYLNMLPLLCLANQALFIRKSVFQVRGLNFDPNYVHFFDYDFYWRLVANGVRFLRVEGLKGAFRQHPEAKGFYQYELSEREAFEIHLASWRTPNLSDDVRRKLRDCLRIDCLNDFGRGRYALMRKHLNQMVAVGGIKMLGGEIALKYLVTLMGGKVIRCCKNVIRSLSQTGSLMKKLNPLAAGLLPLKIGLRSLYHLSLRLVGGHGWRRYPLIQWISSSAQQFFRSSRTTMVDGHIMTVDEKDSLNLRLNGIYEEDETRFIENAIQPGQRVIDIGANIGYYTLKFCRLVGQGGHVFAFEPDPVNFSILQQNLGGNRYTHVTPYQKGVGEADSHVNLYKDTENHGDHRRFNSDHREKVIQMEIVRLDDLPGIRYNPIHFIKMDIQGGEYYALLGMQKLLAENKSIQVLTEFWPYALKEMKIAPQAYLNIWRELGFNFYNLVPGRKGYCEPITLESLLKLIPEEGLGHANILFKRG